MVDTDVITIEEAKNEILKVLRKSCKVRKFVKWFGEEMLRDITLDNIIRQIL